MNILFQTAGFFPLRHRHRTKAEEMGADGPLPPLMTRKVKVATILNPSRVESCTVKRRPSRLWEAEIPVNLNDAISDMVESRNLAVSLLKFLADGELGLSLAQYFKEIPFLTSTTWQHCPAQEYRNRPP